MKRIVSLSLILSCLFISTALISEADADIKIKRLRLYFENKRAETTINKDQPSLKAFADIRFEGTGLLQGYWEVDGRPLTHVHRHIIYGETITVQTPDIPPLPVFMAGTHRIRFVITNPAQNIPFPEAIYFVTAEKFRKMHTVDLIYPGNKSEIDYTPLTFKWKIKNKTVTYLIEFLEKDDEKPVFSAYTKKAEYTLPLPVLKNIFAPEKDYLWRVRGFDTANNMAGESPVNKFTFLKSSQ